MSLIDAVINNNFKEVRKLIKKGVNVNLQEDKYTALYYAIFNYDECKIFKYLSKKAYLNIKNNYGSTVLCFGNITEKTFLCKFGCHLFIKNIHSYTVIINYTKFNFYRTIDLFLQILI